LINRINDDRGKEPGAVLADAPALTDEMLVLARDLERAGWKPLLAIVGRIKDGEMLADNLPGFVAFDALSPRVPIDHVSFRAEHENRIVDHAFDKEAEIALALPRFWPAVRGLSGSFFGPFLRALHPYSPHTKERKGRALVPLKGEADIT